MKFRIPRNRSYLKTNTLLEALGRLLSPKAFSGENLASFEAEFARFIGVKHAIAVSSGKLALQLCLEALGAKEGDKIILSDFNVPEVPALLVCCGLVPVLIDIDSKTFNMDPGLIERHIDPKTKFILVTHMFGVPADMEKICVLARRHQLKIIEDACQATGSVYHGKPVGGFGDAAYFSFGALKVFSTLNGGMVVTDRADVADYVRNEIKDYPFPGRGVLFREVVKALLINFFTSPWFFDHFTFPVLALISRCSEDLRFEILKGEEVSHFTKNALVFLKKKYCDLQAWFGLNNLSEFQGRLSVFRNRLKKLDEALEDSNVVVQRRSPEISGFYFKYVVRVKNRPEFLRGLFRRGIDTTYGYMTACSSIPELNCFSAGCPESDSLMKDHVYLPIHSANSYEEIEYLADVVRSLT